MFHFNFLNKIQIIIITIAIIFLNSCAPLVSKRKPILYEEDAKRLLFHLKEQDSLVDTIYWSGNIKIIKWPWHENLFIFAVGQKSPFRIKMEISHSTGQALYHILIKDEECHVLSFKDKVLYLSKLGNTQVFNSIFSNSISDIDILWDVMRGYPVLNDFKSLIPIDKNTIKFVKNSDNEIVLRFNGSVSNPYEYTININKIEMSFKDIKCSNKICISKMIRITESEKRGRAEIFINRPVFNKRIPNNIFYLSIPYGFVIRNLN